MRYFSKPPTLDSKKDLFHLQSNFFSRQIFLFYYGRVSLLYKEGYLGLKNCEK
jgi:hypothetical protein